MLLNHARPEFLTTWRRLWIRSGAPECHAEELPQTLRVLGGSGDLVTSYVRKLINTINPIRIPFRVPISPPTLQVKPQPKKG